MLNFILLYHFYIIQYVPHCDFVLKLNFCYMCPHSIHTVLMHYKVTCGSCPVGVSVKKVQDNPVIMALVIKNLF